MAATATEWPSILIAIPFRSCCARPDIEPPLIGKSHLAKYDRYATPFQQAEPVPEGTSPRHRQELSHADKTAEKYYTPSYEQERRHQWQDPKFEPTTPYYGFDDVIMASHHFEVAGYHHKRHLDAIDPAIAQNTGPEHAIKRSEHNRQTFASSLAPEHYPTRFIGDATSDWLTTHTAERAETPFFLWCSLLDPHVPWTPPETYYDMYDPAEVVLPDSFYESPRTQTPLLKAVHDNEAGGTRKPRMPFMADEVEARRIIATAYGMITFIDEVVGDLIAKLEETGVADNTVIIFTTDHGDYMGQHGLFLKGPAHYQSLVKVPFIWCDPIPKIQSRPGRCPGELCRYWPDDSWIEPISGRITGPRGKACCRCSLVKLTGIVLAS